MRLPETPLTPNEIKVWDPVVRIFHWSLAAVFAIAWLTGDEESRLHELAGYAVIVLVALRIVWGFIGTRYARFRDFVYPPSVILGYTRDLLIGKPGRYLGHNPLGGAMIMALLISLLAAGATGIAAQGAEAGAGPLASEIWKELHEFSANLTLLLVVLHIAGVIVSSLVHRENLVRAMFTGRKSV